MDILKIDFSKLKLQGWCGLHLRATRRDLSIHIRDGADSAHEAHGAIAARAIDGGDWKVTRQCPNATFADLDQLKAICAQVDAFIERELKSQPQTTVTALSNGFTLKRNPVDQSSEIWLGAELRARKSGTNPWYLTAPSAGWHVTRDGARGIVDATDEADRVIAEQERPWRECTLEEARANPECSEWWLTATPAHKHPMVVWSDELYVGIKSYRTRAPKKEATPALPKVKAPEGLKWEARAGSMCLCYTDESGAGHFVNSSVPKTKADRDAMLACVAAYDEAHGANYLRHLNGCILQIERDHVVIGGSKFLLVEVAP